MTRTIRIAAAAVLAIALFLLGGIGALRGPDPAVVPAAAVPEGGALLRATSGSSVDATIASLQERLDAVPDDAPTMAALGLAYVQRARITADPSALARADALLRAATPDLPEGDASGQLGLAALAAARHDFGASLRSARRAATIAPYDGAVYGVLGDALLELGRYGEAFDAFQRMVDLEPGLGAYARVAYARELQGDAGGARAALEVATGVAPTADDQAFVRYQLGELARTRGDLAAAAASYRAAAAFAPTWVPPRAGLARVAWARGERTRAIAQMREVVARLPLPEHATVLGEMLLATGDRDGAAAQFDVVRAQAALLADAGVNADLEIALFEAEHGDPDAALTAASAEWRRRTAVHVADAYAWALHAVGRDAAASSMIERALRLGTRSATFEYHAGMIAAALGDDAAAAQHLRAALAIDPSFSILGADVARRTLAEVTR